MLYIEPNTLKRLKKALPYGAITRIAREAKGQPMTRYIVFNELTSIKQAYDVDIIGKALEILNEMGYPTESFDIQLPIKTKARSRT